MTIPPAAVIALRDLIAKWRDHAEISDAHTQCDLEQCADDLDALLARVERELVEAKRVEALGDREVYEANHDRDVWHRAYHETKARAEKAERELAELKATACVEPPPQEQDDDSRYRADVAARWFSADGSMMCEAHPGMEWPHGDCLGPGMPWVIRGRTLIRRTIRRAPPTQEPRKS